VELAVEGATLNLEVDGPADAPAVLLWHGAGCTLRMWDHVVGMLADRYRLVRFDVRGVGQSTPTADPDTEYTLERYAADADAILDHLDIDRVHVWSMAWGSRAALAYCALRASRVISAMLNDASIGRANVDAQREGSRRALMKQSAEGIERFPRPEGWNLHHTPESVAKAMAAAGKFDLPAAVPALTMPILVVTGDHDPNLESSRDLVARAPDARLVVLKNVGHGSVLQRPDLVISEFLEFQSGLAG
jgi:3-oxoadipate enol-lactonase